MTLADTERVAREVGNKLASDEGDTVVIHKAQNIGPTTISSAIYQAGDFPIYR